MHHDVKVIDIEDGEGEPKVDKVHATADVKHFFQAAPHRPHHKKPHSVCILCRYVFTLCLCIFLLQLLIIACYKGRQGLRTAGLYSYSWLNNSTKTYGIPSSGTYISFISASLSITILQLRSRIANGARRIISFLCSLMMQKLAVQPSKMLPRSKQPWMITSRCRSLKINQSHTVIQFLRRQLSNGWLRQIRFVFSSAWNCEWLILVHSLSKHSTIPLSNTWLMLLQEQLEGLIYPAEIELAKPLLTYSRSRCRRYGIVWTYEFHIFFSA